MKNLIKLSTVGLLFSGTLLMANIPEPDIVFYGKVTTQVGLTEIPVIDGNLSWDIKSKDENGKSYHFSTKLKSLSNGQYSYQLKIPQEVLTGLDTLQDKETEVITIKDKQELFLRHYAISVNGETALISNEALQFFSVNEEKRAKSQRLDLLVPNSVLGDKLDSDKNGLPDVWESLYGLNGADANRSSSFDSDGDGWTNLEEFNQGTNPTINNKLPVLVSDLGVTNKEEYKVTLFENGLTQLRVNVLDSDSDLDEIDVTFKSIPQGLSLVKSSDVKSPLSVGSSVLASELNSGEILLRYRPIIDMESNSTRALDNLLLSLDDRGPRHNSDANNTAILKKIKLEVVNIDAISEPLRWIDGKAYRSKTVSSLKGRSGERDDVLALYSYNKESKDFASTNSDIRVDKNGLIDFSNSHEILAFEPVDNIDNALNLSGLGSVYTVFSSGKSKDSMLFNDGFTSLEFYNNYLSSSSSNTKHYVESTEPSNVGLNIWAVHRDVNRSIMEHNAQSVGGILPHVQNYLTVSSAMAGFGMAWGRAGKLDGYAKPFDGKIAEFIAFPYVLNSMKKSLVNAYLLSKWSDYVVSDASGAISNTRLKATNHKSILLGGLSADVLIGSDFDDILIGAEGEDSLSGGSGNDTFMVENGDSIEDFSFNYASSKHEDIIDISALLSGGDEDLKQCLFLKIEDGNTLFKINELCKGEDFINGSDFKDSSFTMIGHALLNSELPLLWYSGSLYTGAHKPSNIEASISMNKLQNVKLNENNALAKNQEFKIDINYNSDIAFEGNSLKLPLELKGTATPHKDYNLTMTRFISIEDEQTIKKVTKGKYNNFSELLDAPAEILKSFNLTIEDYHDSKRLRQEKYDLLETLTSKEGSIFLPAQFNSEDGKSVELTLTLIHDEIKEEDESLSLELLEVPEYYRVTPTKNKLKLTLTDGLDKVFLEPIKDNIYEGDKNYFKVTRVGSIDSRSSVNILLSGSAKNGVDYESILNQVIFEAGERSVELGVSTFEDNVEEKSEVIELVLEKGTNYEIINPDNKAIYYLKDSSANAVDEDKDGLLDSWEVEVGLNPLVSNLNTDGSYHDTDGDGLDDKEEYLTGTNPTNRDSDGDGIIDSKDVNPLSPQRSTEIRLGNQEIKISNGNSIIVPAEMESIVKIPFIYNTSTNDDRLEGLGLKLQYNQAQLEFLSFSNVLKHSYQRTNGTATPNDVYRGNFRLFSHEVGISWFAKQKNWPMMPLPTKLVVARFKVKDSISDKEESIVKISSTKTSTGYLMKDVQFKIVSKKMDGLSSSAIEVKGNNSQAKTELLTRAFLGLEGDNLMGQKNSDTKMSNRIIKYAKESSLLYDIDGDGEVNPLVDMVLLYRYLKGTLKAEDVEGLLNENSVRRTLGEVEDAIQRVLDNR